MKTKRHRIVLVVLLVAGLGGIAGLIIGQREPVYQGRGLSVWLFDRFNLYEDYYLQLKSGSTPAFTRQAEVDQVDVAIRHFGTNALPELLQLAGARDSTIKKWLVKIDSGKVLPRLHLRSERESHAMALSGFIALGEAARPAVPALRELLKQDRPEIQSTVIEGLGDIGPAAADAVPDLVALVNNTNVMIRFCARFVLGNIHAQPSLAVPALTANLAGNPMEVLNSLRALGKFGADAKAAVPALLPLLTNSNVSLRIEATNALKQIDPEAAAKAGVK